MKRKDYLVTGNYFEVYLWLILVLAKSEQSKVPTSILQLLYYSKQKTLANFEDLSTLFCLE